MEVAIPYQKLLDSDFNSPMPSPPPPKRFGDYYFSAPTSPNHLPHFYCDYDDLSVGGGSAMVSDAAAASLPFGWEGKPKSSSPGKTDNRGEYDFAFDVSGDQGKGSLCADDLFHGGVIKPLKPPTAAEIGENAASRRKNPAAVYRSPISQTRKLIQGAFSPRHWNKEEIGPFAAAAQNDTRSATAPPRGRERRANQPISSRQRAARSLSPIRDAQFPWEEEKDEQPPDDPANSTPSAVCSALSATLRCHKKWRLKDFFLFRSASEGRAANKDPLKKYTAAFRHASDGSGSGSGSRRRGPVSAHELHYTVNRAASEDLKKKTFLPYKQGILGRLAFNPTAHALANGFGFSRK